MNRILGNSYETVERKMPDESARALARFVGDRMCGTHRDVSYQEGQRWADVLEQLDRVEAHIGMIEAVTCDFENTYGIPDGRHFLPLIILTLFYAETQPYFPKVKAVRDHLERIA